MASYATCTSVSPACPVEATTYGYAPNLAGNIVLLVVFGICTIAQFTLGIKNHIRAFTFAATVGCLGETLGYGGRLIMHQNPWSQTGFQMQIVCLILSPSFLAAGLYLTLKHLVIYYGPQYSKLKPVLYTWIFIGCDAVSIVTQAAGGGIAASHQANLVTIGDYVMVAGICIQVATMAACAVMGVDFALRLHRSRGNVSDEKTFVDEQENSDRGRAPKSLRFFMSCMTLAFVTIFIRSVYRYASNASASLVCRIKADSEAVSRRWSVGGATL